MTRSSPENIVRLFGMSGLMVESDLQRISRKHDVDIGRATKEPVKDQVYYPQFEQAVRSEANMMAARVATDQNEIRFQRRHRDPDLVGV